MKARCPLKEVVAPHFWGLSSDRALFCPLSLEHPKQFWQSISLCPFFLAPCLCPFVNKHFISGSQAGWVAFPGDEGNSRLLSCPVSCLWPKHTHSASLKSGYLRRYTISINQYTSSHSHFCQLPQKLVPLLKDHGNHSKVLGASLGETQWRVKMWMRLRTHTL